MYLINSLLHVSVCTACAADDRWIRGEKRTLQKSDLTKSQFRLKDFNAKRKMKGAVKTVMAVNKMQKAAEAFGGK